MRGTILIVDDVATNRIVLKSRLADASYDVAMAAGGAEAAAVARRLRPDLALIGATAGDAGAVPVIAALRADPATAAVPILARCAPADGPGRRAVLAAGADGLLDCDSDPALMLARVRGLMRDRAPLAEASGLGGLAEAAVPFAGPARIALVAGQPANALRWRAALAPHGPDRIEAMAPAAALDGAPADLYVIVADGRGFGPMADLRARPGSRDAAYCIVLAAGSDAAAAMALDLGAGDVLAEGVDPAEAALRLRILLSRKRAADATRAAVRAGLAAAVVDPLTGLWNRRHALPALARMAAAPASCAAMLIDIDRFKAVNDRHGHAAGDAALRAVAGHLRAGAGPGALVARLGGEEFLVALPAVTAALAREAAERLRLHVAAQPVELPSGAALRLTVSIGVALSAPGSDPAALLAAADRALFCAKAEGRNLVTLCPCAA